MARKTWPHNLVPGLTVIPGERWAPAPDCPDCAVSTEGRAVRLPRVIRQKSRFGTMMDMHLPGRVMRLLRANPRLIIRRRDRDGHRGYDLVDFGRQVLAAFVRPPRGSELARRLNGILPDCRLANLRWTSDVKALLLERFLANDKDCQAGMDIEHAAIRLGVSRSSLCRVLDAERDRHGLPKPWPAGPARVAAMIHAARAGLAAREAGPHVAA